MFMAKRSAKTKVLKLFGDALRVARLKAGLTQEEAAEYMGTDRVSWSMMENGKRNISLDKAYRASVAVNSTLAKLTKKMS